MPGLSLSNPSNFVRSNLAISTHFSNAWFTLLHSVELSLIPPSPPDSSAARQWRLPEAVKLLEEFHNAIHKTLCSTCGGAVTMRYFKAGWRSSMAEQWFCKPQVGGSIPLASSTPSSTIPTTSLRVSSGAGCTSFVSVPQVCPYFLPSLARGTPRGLPSPSPFH